MVSYAATTPPRQSTNGSKPRGSEDEGVMATASLEVLSVTETLPQGPAMYEAVYTRGGWSWRTSHRYRDWLKLKESLTADFGKLNLPDDRAFPQKEDVVAIAKKLLSSCQVCREGGAAPVGILEDRRQGLKAYFSEVLMEHRDVWDGSDEIENFFFPGAPTSYSAALSRRRSEQLKEEKLKEKGSTNSKSSAIASSLKSTLGSIFESSPSPPARTTPTRPSISTFGSIFEASPSPPTPSSARSSADNGPPSPESQKKTEGGDAGNGDYSGGGGGGGSVSSTGSSASSILNRISAKIPSFRDFLFDTPLPSSSSQPLSQHGSRDGTKKGSQNKVPRPGPGSSKPPSDSGVTDLDEISENGWSKHSNAE